MSTRTAFSYLSQQYQRQQYQWSSSCASHLARCSLFFAISSLLMTFLFKACKAKQHQLNQLVTSKNDEFLPGLASNARELCQGPLLSDAIFIGVFPSNRAKWPTHNIAKVKRADLAHQQLSSLCKRGDAKQEKYVVLDGHLLVRRVSILSE